MFLTASRIWIIKKICNAFSKINNFFRKHYNTKSQDNNAKLDHNKNLEKRLIEISNNSDPKNPFSILLASDIIDDKEKSDEDIADILCGAKEYNQQIAKSMFIEHEQKLINLHNISNKAEEYCKTISPKSNLREEMKKINNDWANDFVDIAKRRSGEEMQSLLAKILVAEALQSNSYSARSFKTLTEMNKSEIEIFKRIAKYTDQKGYVLFDINDKNEGNGGLSFLNFNEITLLQNIGLLSYGDQIIVFSSSENKEIISFQYRDNILIKFENHKKQQSDLKNNERFELRCRILTNIGLELRQLFINNVFDVEDWYFINIQKKYRESLHSNYNISIKEFLLEKNTNQQIITKTFNETGANNET